MSEKQNRDFSQYDLMSTDELEEILRLDCDAPEGGESDTELLLYVMEVLANRRNANNTGKTAQQAWESFQQNYLPDGDAPLEYTKKPAKRTSSWLRRLIAAAAVIVLLVFVPLSAAAFEWEDIWNAVAKWAKETFSFISAEEPLDAPSPENANQYESLQQALAATNVEFDSIPTWMPEKYQLGDLTIDEMPGRKVYLAIYLNGEKTLRISVQSYIETDPEKIEINEDLIEIYEASGIDFYIFTNMNQIQAIWFEDSFECCISGDLTIEEIKMMIDSIGKG